MGGGKGGERTLASLYSMAVVVGRWSWWMWFKREPAKSDGELCVRAVSTCQSQINISSFKRRVLCSRITPQSKQSNISDREGRRT